MNITELWEELSKLPNAEKRDVYLHIYKGDGSHSEHGIRDWCSYRGYYEHVALCPTSVDSPLRFKTLASLIALLESIPGKTMEGWKGGEYTATNYRPLWIAGEGECSDVQPVFIQTYRREGVTDVYIVCAPIQSY